MLIISATDSSSPYQWYKNQSNKPVFVKSYFITFYGYNLSKLEGGVNFRVFILI